MKRNVMILLLYLFGMTFVPSTMVYGQPSYSGDPVFLLPHQHEGHTPTSSANDYVPPSTVTMQYGLNPGYYGSNWSDMDIYGLCHDAGCRSARNTLPDSFIAQWGVNIRKNTFEQITRDLGFDGITTFLQGPRQEWADGKLWQGMYEPIWDNGENDTPVNDSNRFALYVWLIVNTYGPYITYYEIINEPDYTSTDHGWQGVGVDGNWWENVPQPADLKNLQTTVFRYIRLLRIASEVVKQYDPEGYVTPGGLGYRSFLDCLLRYTDNPVDGTVSAEYPLKGGAYFNALSMHNYPQFTTREWDGSTWLPKRHSDKAADVFIAAKEEFEQVLHRHGYDGLLYPKKPFIVTELNVPRRQIGETLGGIEMQRNFTIKALVKAQMNGIEQIYWYATGEAASYNAATNPFDLMGFYEKLSVVTHGHQVMTDQAIAHRTTFEQLYGYQFDAVATAALDLPETIDGGIFVMGLIKKYVLWARTATDRSESASASVSLSGVYSRVQWDGSVGTVTGPQIELTGAPVFLIPQ